MSPPDPRLERYKPALVVRAEAYDPRRQRSDLRQAPVE